MTPFKIAVIAVTALRLAIAGTIIAAAVLVGHAGAPAAASAPAPCLCRVSRPAPTCGAPSVILGRIAGRTERMTLALGRQCEVWRTIAYPATPLAVVGDSITVYSEPEITSLTPGALYFAHIGYTIPESAAHLSEALASHPAALVFNLGTNDAILGLESAPANLAADFAEIHAAGIANVAVVTINLIADDYSHTDLAVALNREMDAYAALYGWTIIDWNAEVASGAPVLVMDGIHPNTAGRQWFAEQYQQLTGGGVAL